MNLRQRMHYRAVSMELAAYLDGRYVEMHIVTDRGETISVACPNDSIFAIQRHIEQIGRECPEIASWSGRDQRALDPPPRFAPSHVATLQFPSR